MTWHFQEQTIPRHDDYQLYTPVDNSVCKSFENLLAIVKENSGIEKIVDGSEAST